MSQRDYWDEDSFQKYREDLTRKRNELNPVTQQFQIKIYDKMIKDLPDRYLDSQVDFKKSKQVCEDNSHKKSFISKRVALVISILLCVTLYLLLLSTAFTAKRDTYICYTTRTGECYHDDSCWYLKSAYETTVYEASQKGYRPCSRCNPCYKGNKTTIVTRNHTYPILISIPVSVTVFLLLGYQKKE